MKKTEEEIYKKRWLILFTVVMMTFMACLDSSIINVALPVMAKKLSVNMASIEWVVTIYLIVISALILTFGRLGDIIGKTTVFSIGTIVFTIGSLLCGLSSSLNVLIIARALQAIGAAGTMSNSFGIITAVFPVSERGRSLGINSTFVALGTMIGPALGGFITGSFSWNYIFLINVPVGVVTFILGMKILPRRRGEIKEKLDWKGAVLFAVTIVLLFFSMIFGQKSGFSNPLIVFSIIVAAAAFILFILVETRMDMPLIHLELFKSSLFSISVFCGFISFIAISCSNIILPFYFQDILKLSPEATGMFMMVSPLILTIISPASGYISDKIGSEILTFIGLALITAGLFLVSTLTQSSSITAAVVYITVISIGTGLFQPPNNSLVMSSVPKNKLGIAGSINSLVRNLGMILGITLSTSILYNRMSSKIGYPVFNYINGREDVFIYGMKYVYITAAAICLAGAAVTALRLHSAVKNQ